MSLEHEAVLTRNLRPSDMESVIRLDSKITGKRRDEYFKVKLAQALSDTGIQVSLAAEIDGAFVGFLLARVYYGEFGETERVAMLDTLDVHPDFKGKGIGKSLLRQLRGNLLGLGIAQLQTEVSWRNAELMTFFNRSGFAPAPRYCLDMDLAAVRAREETDESMQQPL